MKSLSMGIVSVLLAAACLFAACCSGERASDRSGSALGSGSAIVAGTVVDAATGDPVSDARIRGPRDTKAKSDAKGRFELRGLKTGDEGELVATAEDGRTGRVDLRALKAGRLEVVIHVASQRRDD